MFGFVQLEFPWELGPADGRYVVRGHAGVPQHVVVTQTLGAQQRRLLGGRRARAVPREPDPEPVPTSRVTIVGVDDLGDADAAKAWLRGADLESEALDGLRTLNRVLHVHRLAAADPGVHEVRLEQALVARVGFGAGEEVAHGRWTDASALPPAARSKAIDRRGHALRPQERLAAVLGLRDAVLACEELVLRARTDLDADRPREAAFQLRVALEAALSELEPWRGRHGIGERLDELRDERRAVGDAANAALLGGLDDPTTADVERVVGRLEAVLRARAAGGFDV